MAPRHSHIPVKVKKPAQLTLIQRAHIPAAMSKIAEKQRPKWDGVHGWLITILPRQNQFTLLDNHFHFPELPPEKPVKEPIDTDLHTKICVGIASDRAPAKATPTGRITRAGEPVFLRLVADSEKKFYNLTAVDGTAISHAHVFFSEEWGDSQD